jgi:hypothetical protein
LQKETCPLNATIVVLASGSLALLVMAIARARRDSSEFVLSPAPSLGGRGEIPSPRSPSPQKNLRSRLTLLAVGWPNNGFMPFDRVCEIERSILRLT